jgi:hypothetical protein
VDSREMRTRMALLRYYRHRLLSAPESEAGTIIRRSYLQNAILRRPIGEAVFRRLADSKAPAATRILEHFGR